MIPSSPDFVPVSSEEMGFALTLFVEAANSRVSPALPLQELVLEDPCALLYVTLCADMHSPLPAIADRAPESDREAALYGAFRVLCLHYAGDPLQASVCARVLAFYFLMERSAGAALAGWTQEIPESPELVSRLNGSVLLSPSTFPDLVAETAAKSEPGPN